jgi:hypothetical protein
VAFLPGRIADANARAWHNREDKWFDWRLCGQLSSSFPEIADCLQGVLDEQLPIDQPRQLLRPGILVSTGKFG